MLSLLSSGGTSTSSNSSCCYCRRLNPHIPQKESRDEADPDNRHDRDKCPHDSISAYHADRLLVHRREIWDGIETLRVVEVDYYPSVSAVQEMEGIVEPVIEHATHDSQADRPTERERKAHQEHSGGDLLGPDPRNVQRGGHEPRTCARAGQDHHAVYETGITGSDSPCEYWETDCFCDRSQCLKVCAGRTLHMYMAK